MRSGSIVEILPLLLLEWMSPLLLAGGRGDI